MTITSFPAPRPATATAALRLFLGRHAEDLIEAAGLLGGAPAISRTTRLIEEIAPEEGAISRRLRQGLVALHRLLTLQEVHVPDSLEAAQFAAIDPASPVVEEICLLSDGLLAQLEDLAEEDESFAEMLAAA